MNIETTEKTFGKETQKQIKKLFKGSLKLKKVSKDLVIIKDSTEKRLGSWHKVEGKNGIIVVL